MVKVPVAPQVQPQVQQEQVAAPQFQAAPSPGMQSAMQLGQDLMRAGQMAMELQRDERAMELWRAREERREQIAQGREEEAAAKEAERLKAKADDIIVDGAIGVVANQIGEVVDIYGRTTGRESLDRWKESSTVIDGLVKDMRDKLQDELQIKMFDTMVKGRVGSAKRTINDHYSKQLDSEQAIARAGRLGTLGQEFARSPEIQDVYTAAAAAEENIRLQYTAPSGVVNEDMAKAATQDWYRSYLPVLVDRRIANNDHAGAHMVVKVLDEGGRLDADLSNKLQNQIASAEEAYSSREVAKNLVREGRTGGLTQFESTKPDPNAKPLPRTFDGKPDYNAIRDVIDGADRPDSWKEQAKSHLDGMERDQVRAEQRAYNLLLEQARSICWSDEAYRLGYSLYNELEERAPGLAAKLRQEDKQALKELPVKDDPLVVMQIEDGIISGEMSPEDAVSIIIANGGNITKQTSDRLIDLTKPASQELSELRSYTVFLDDAVSQHAKNLLVPARKAELAALKANVRLELSRAQAAKERAGQGRLTDVEMQGIINSTVIKDQVDVSGALTWGKVNIPAASVKFADKPKILRSFDYIDASGQRQSQKISIRQQEAIRIIALQRGVQQMTPSIHNDIYSDMVSGKMDLTNVVGMVLLGENISPFDASADMKEAVLKDLRERR